MEPGYSHGEDEEKIFDQFLRRKKSPYRYFYWALAVSTVFFGFFLLAFQFVDIFPQRSISKLEKVHPFLIPSAVANHAPNTQMEAVQIWLCDHCHNTRITLTNGTTREIGTSSLGGGGTQTVSQGQEWGPTVAGMFSGKHATAVTDALGQTSQTYATYLNSCYGPGTNAASVTGANMEPCRSGGGVSLIPKYDVMPPDGILSQPNETCVNTSGAYTITTDPDCPIQQNVSQFVGTATNQNLGKSVAIIGDLGTPTNPNPDGRKDFATGDGAPGTNGRVWVISGADRGSGITGWNIPPTAADTLICRIDGGTDFGANVAAPGDLTGDGVPDILVAGPGASGGNGSVWLFDGSLCAGGAVLNETNAMWTFVGQSGDRVGSVALVGADLGGANNAPEVLAMAPLANSGAGKVYVLDGSNGTALMTINGAAGENLGGGGFPSSTGTPSTTLSNLYGADGLRGDANNDGFFDIVVGAPGVNQIRIISGNPADAGAVLAQIDGPSATKFGSAVAGLGNRIAIGAPNANNGNPLGGRAFVYTVTPGTPPTISLLHTLENPRTDANCGSNCLDANEQFGLTVIAVGDVSQNIEDDVLVGSPYVYSVEIVKSNSDPNTTVAPDGGLAVIFSGGQPVHTVESGGRGRNVPASFYQVGYSAAAGDIDSDGRPDLLIGGAQSDIHVSGGTVIGSAGSVASWWNVTPLATVQLSVTKSGSGTGTVTSNPIGINCGTDCSEEYPLGTVVTLTPTPDAGSIFSGWTGSDPDCNDGMVTMNSDMTCNAEFTAQFTLTVNKAGSGTGVVTSNPAGINCGPDCSENYDSGTVVNLTATADPGSRFVGWSGDAGCSDGSVTMTQNLTCTATFTAQYTLNITKDGTGTGTVTSNPPGINCGSDCSEVYDDGTVVNLTPTPDDGSVFVGWSGDTDCGDGAVTMTSNITCNATFDTSAPGTFSLTITKSGSGAGTVTSNPAGINCGPDCNEVYGDGTVVTLTAAPNAGSRFSGWSGNDPDCNDGIVTMTKNLTCNADFTKVFTLSVNKTGSGTGTVTSNPAGINCGADCSEIYDINTVVTLTPTPDSGFVFGGWSGTDADCNDGTVTMTKDLTCTATFSAQFTLTITLSGAGSGTVTSNPAGINCGSDCSEAYPDGTDVALTATPDAGSVFAGWSGDPDCTDGSVTMNANKTCDAAFDVDSGRLGNLSTRAFVGTGNNVEIGGFIIEGTSPKTVLIRARGPSLSGAPFNLSGTLSDPFMRVFNFATATFIAQNDNWQTSDPLCETSGYSCGTPAEITATGLDPCIPNPGQTTAPPGCTQESAVLITLPPGQYGAIVSGVSNGTGIGLAEVFDIDGGNESKLGNISTRAFVGTGNNVEIGGFIIEGADPRTVLIRARGPSLSGAPFNLSGTLSDPFMRVFNFATATFIAQNDNWQTSDPLCETSGYSCGTPAEITATGLDPCIPNPGQTTAPPGCTQESAVLITLPPGQYGAIVSGVSNGTGIGLVEVFDQTSAGPATRTLTVAKAGTGTGTVTSSPAGINCGTDCTEVYNEGTVVTLTPTAGPSSVFDGWSGAADCSDGVVTMNADLTCTATFNEAFSLTVTKSGTGFGTVTSNPVGINCGSDCTENYLGGTVVTLTPTPDAGSIFSGWSGNADCSDGSVTMDNNKTCNAIFDQAFTLTVTKAGTGTGTVTSDPVGINCGSDCNESYVSGTVVSLTATPDTGSLFSGWSGDPDCSDGSVTMNADKTCTATFDTAPPATFSLSVTKSGTGTGTVTSSPAGINCGADCSQNYADGTIVTLTATPDSGSTFTGWSGDPDCVDGTVTVDTNITCDAEFDILFTLTVTLAGTGNGTVTSSPSGINCGSDCTEDYISGTVVNLTDNPANGSTFDGWSGDADCMDGSVTMNANKTCTATFNLVSPGTTAWEVEVGPANGYTVHTSANPADIGSSGPAHITIYEGDTIDWNWTDSNHSATSTTDASTKVFTTCSNGESFDTGVFDPPHMDSTTLNNVTPAGNDCQFFCLTHSNNMRGSITVLSRAGNAAPTEPTLLGVQVVGYNWIELTWTGGTDDLGVTSYNIYRNGTLVGTKKIELGSTTTSFVDTTGQPNTSYTYTVTSVDGATAESGPSNSVPVTTTVTKLWEVEVGPGNQFTTRTSQNPDDINTPRVTIYENDKIRWTWTDPNHSVTSTPGPNSQFVPGPCSSGDNFDSGVISAIGFEFIHLFNNGPSPPSDPCLYFCTQHASITGQQITILPRP